MASLSSRLLLGFLFLCIVACTVEGRGARGGGRFRSSRYRYRSSGGSYYTSSSGSTNAGVIVGIIFGVIGGVVVLVVLVVLCKCICSRSSGSFSSRGTVIQAPRSPYQHQAAIPQHTSSLTDMNGFSKAGEPPSYDSAVNQKGGLPYPAEPNGNVPYPPPAMAYNAADDDDVVMSYPAQTHPDDDVVTSYPPFPSDPSAPPYYPAGPAVPMDVAQNGVAPQAGPGYIGFTGNTTAV